MRLDRLRSVRWPYLLAFACVAVAVVIGLFVSLSGGDESVREVDGLPYRSYAFEARMTSPDATGTTIIRGWYEAPSRTRWDIGPEGPEYDGRVRVLILTEKGSVIYEPSNNTYGEDAHASGAKLPPVPYPLVSNAAIGPMVSYLDPAKALPLGKETLLGVQGDVYKQDGVRWVVDPKREFVMKQEFDAAGPMSNVKIEITWVEFDRGLPASTWAFTPPADAKRLQPGASAPPGPAQTRTPVVNPFLSPDYVPNGYGNPRTEQSASGRGDLLAERRTWELGAQSFEIRQVVQAGRPPITPLGTPVSQDDFNAVWVTQGDVLVLAWNAGELVISVSSSNLPLEELVRIAESLR